MTSRDDALPDAAVHVNGGGCPFEGNVLLTRYASGRRRQSIVTWNRSLDL